MRSEIKKGEREVRVFIEFLEKSHFHVDHASVEKRDPPEPDILCRHFDEGFIAFELVELCDPNIAAALNKCDPPEVEYFSTSDPSIYIVRKKRSKAYESCHPVELLCYTAGRIITTDDAIIPTIRPYFECDPGQFRRVWFLGEAAVEVIYDAV